MNYVYRVEHNELCLQGRTDGIRSSDYYRVNSVCTVEQNILRLHSRTE
jgi:hypothetical protein